MKTLNVYHRGKLVGSIFTEASTGISFKYSDDDVKLLERTWYSS